MKVPIITEDTRKPISQSLREELENIWDKDTVDKGYGYFESDIFDIPGKPSYAKHIERLDDMDVFDSDMEAAFYGEKFFGEKIFHYDLGEDDQMSYFWFVDEPETRSDVEAYLDRRYGPDHGFVPDYETIRREEIIFEGLAEDLKDAVAVEYKGIVFDEWTVDEENGGVWGEMCACCAEKYKDTLSDELSEGGVGACSVKGCDVVGDLADTETHYYVDFKPKLIVPLSAEVVKVFDDIAMQLKNKENTTSYGEPRAWAYLSNGRSIEVVLEQEGLEEKDYYYSVRLHCNGAEYDDHEYQRTDGVIDSYNSGGVEFSELAVLIANAFQCNERFPVNEEYVENNSLESKIVEAQAQGSLLQGNTKDNKNIGER